MADNFKLTVDYIIYSEPMNVFEAFTDSGIIGAWGGGLSIVEPEIGGAFELFDGWVKGNVTIYEPGKLLGYTWKPEEWQKKTPPSEVKIKFTKHSAGTQVFIQHEKFPSQEEADKHYNGWMDYVLDPMNDYFTLQKEEK